MSGPRRARSQKLGFFNPGTLQSAQMTGLAPATRYWYRVGDSVRPADTLIL